MSFCALMWSLWSGFFIILWILYVPTTIHGLLLDVAMQYWFILVPIFLVDVVFLCPVTYVVALLCVMWLLSNPSWNILVFIPSNVLCMIALMLPLVWIFKIQNFLIPVHVYHYFLAIFGNGWDSMLSSLYFYLIFLCIRVVNFACECIYFLLMWFDCKSDAVPYSSSCGFI